VGGQDTSQLNPTKLKETVFERPQGEALAKQEKSKGTAPEERPRATKPTRRPRWSEMVEQDEAETARVKAETARARAEWEARKKEEAGGQVNPTEEQAVELPSRLARDTLNK
jgi:hypothetical protein